MQLHGPFLQGVFGEVLGYRTWNRGEGGFDLHQEVPVRGGRQVDGAIGWFGEGEGRVFAPIELKGAGRSLDAAGSRASTPVEQAWGYANRAGGCRWVIVSNYRETRLYSTARSMEDYERFDLDTLGDPEAFRRFWLLLSRDALLPASPDAAAPLDTLLAGSARAQDQVTDTLYREYRAIRRDLLDRLRRAHPDRPSDALLAAVQKLLDRFLFVAFAEDRGLVPRDTLRDALAHVDPYHPRPVWQNLQAVFAWVDRGNPARGIAALNGGLFAPDPELDALFVDDEACRALGALARYDFGADVSVEVLGHIFEQSITELEELRADGGASRRAAEGVFYTPPFLTRFVVDQTLGRTLDERFAALVDAVAPESARGPARRREAWIEVWTRYREALRGLRVLDPACGSGAFLIAAFERLHREYERVNASLAELRGGQVELFDLDRVILTHNLFGMDVNPESVELTRLSLWLKTARRDRPLCALDGTIRCGNSVVSDPALHPRAVDWGAVPGWPAAFDVVLGNPPYVRQERLGAYKEHWRGRFAAWDGVADLYVFFVELGLGLLAPGGRLGFVVANKWLKAGYAGPLRALLAREATVESVVDFGHAPIFPDADAFPSAMSLRRAAPPAEHAVAATRFPRAELGLVPVDEYARARAFPVPQARLGREPWTLDDPREAALLDRLRARGVPLAAYAGGPPLYGVKTGLNEAFLVDAATRARLVAEDPRTAGVLRPYLRGADVDRWAPDWDGQWFLVLPSSTDRRAPWTDAPDPEAAFRAALPAVWARLKPMEAALRARTDQGRYWWELRPCAYYEAFDRPKILYQRIQFHSCHALDTRGLFTNDMLSFLPTDDPWLLASLNSAVLWWHNFRHLQHGKDEALRPFGEAMRTVPIPPPSAEDRAVAAERVPRLVEDTAAVLAARRSMRDWLRVELGVERPGPALAEFHRLDGDAFVAEVARRRPRGAGRLRPAELATLREVHAAESAAVVRRLAAVAEAEAALSARVIAAFGLDADDLATLRATAPPRMPPGL